MRDDAGLERAMLALDGLSIGDAFGQHVLRGADPAWKVFARRDAPPGPWRHSDDTAMASVLVEHLAAYGAIQRDELAVAFAKRFEREPDRGYGAVAHWILARIGQGEDWREVSRTPYGGSGSMGNGAAMRVAPVAAWFADDAREAVRAATASAEVTHAHPEGIAGAVAVAAASVFAWRARRDPGAATAKEMLAFVVAQTPDGRVREGLREATKRLGATPEDAAKALGDGSEVTAPDTVPYAVWCAATGLGGYEDAMWRCASGLTAEGADRDTVLAIVGGVVALAVGAAGIPAAWREAREALAVELE